MLLQKLEINLEKEEQIILRKYLKGQNRKLNKPSVAELGLVNIMLFGVDKVSILFNNDVSVSFCLTLVK